MKAERLLRHYERIAEAPDAVEKLRRLIRDLAVRGKLVEQDLRDSSPPSISPKQMVAFDGGAPLPANWTWIPLDALITKMDSGWSPQCEDQSRVSEEEWAVLKTTAVQALAFNSSQNKVLPQKLVPRPQYVAAIGDILITRAGPKNRVGISCVVDVPCPRLMISDKLIRFHVIAELYPAYVALALNAGLTLERIEEAKTGMAVMQMNISQVKLRTVPIPVPPLAEQLRIVGKVDELMALCDQLEAARVKREATRDRLATSSLARVSTPDPETFPTDARFALDALPSLTTRHDQIKQLRLTVLNLAVRGKLVPQSASHDTGQRLLVSILRGLKSRRRVVGLDEEALDEPLPTIPSSWTWASVDQLADDAENAITDGPFGSQLKTEHYIEHSGYRVVRLQNIGAGVFRREHLSYIDAQRFGRLAKHHVYPGDLVVAGLVDPSVRCCQLPGDIGPAIVKADCYRFSVHPKVSSRYLLYFLNSPLAASLASAHHHGMTLTRIGLGNFRRIPVPLPPKAEQERIVAKVDELMALCDQLEANLTIADDTRRRLLDALLHEALSPAPNLAA